MLVPTGIHALKALSTVNRSVTARTERHLGRLTAVVANYVVHFAGTTATAFAVAAVLTVTTAFGATPRVARKILASIKFLLASREYEFVSAFLAN